MHGHQILLTRKDLRKKMEALYFQHSEILHGQASSPFSISSVLRACQNFQVILSHAVSSISKWWRDFKFPIEAGSLQSFVHLFNLNMIRFSNIPIDSGSSVMAAFTMINVERVNTHPIDSGNDLRDLQFLISSFSRDFKPST
ncbi:hypothetical protein HYC85_017683 [Camellia sinensis]|uniref:Uncharacterized protein n=1 Tax=Camellia sinensis TaxID=4442 RepID=A0A7J7GVQ9_CAMSI|nr:hypothetical protein HYC85_017683 [Camellia sinensis]